MSNGCLASNGPGNLGPAGDYDMLHGLSGDDSHSGGGGDDFLYAGDGNDTLLGGADNDALYAKLAGEADSIDSARFLSALPVSHQDSLWIDAQPSRATALWETLGYTLC